MILTFECLDEMPTCNHLNESYPVERCGDAVYIIKLF